MSKIKGNIFNFIKNTNYLHFFLNSLFYIKNQLKKTYAVKFLLFYINNYYVNYAIFAYYCLV